MKPILLLTIVLIFSALASAQSLQTAIRNEAGVIKLQVFSFWPTGTAPGLVQANAQFYLAQVASLGGSFSGPATQINNPGVVCSFDDCKFPIPGTIVLTDPFILFIDYNGKRYWVLANPYEKADIKPSKDVENKRQEVLVVSKVPLDPAQPFTLNQSQFNISDNAYFVKELKSQIPVRSFTDNDPSANNANVTEITLELDKKLDEGTVANLSTDGLTTANGSAIPSSGSIEIAGLPGPTEPPKTQISFSHIAADHQVPVFDLSGSVAFRTPKFDSLGGRYLSPKPRDSFAGFMPSVNFDIGFNSTKSKNSIVVNLPFVYYFNYKNREIIDAKIDVATAAEKAAELAAGTKSPVFPLYVYGGWANTPFFRLADIKLSIGPKIELYRKYYPRNFLATVRADFEFHRWLGTIASRRLLLSFDLNTTASRDDDRKLFGKLRDVDFGWKFVPYLAFDAGGHLTKETVMKRLANVNQTVVVPNFAIARFYGGGVGTFEWLVNRRIASINFDYSLYYLGTTEMNSYTTETQLLLRRVRGFQPFFKTVFEFSLDPARRYAFKATYENGRALPGTEYLNKVTTGISVSY
jgi:hypothetical protein